METPKDGDFSKYVDQLLKEQSEHLTNQNSNVLDKIIAENKDNSLEQTKERLKNKDEKLAQKTAEFIEKVNAGAPDANQDLSSIWQNAKNNKDISSIKSANTRKETKAFVKTTKISSANANNSGAIFTLIKVIALIYILVIFFFNFWQNHGIVAQFLPLFLVPAIFLVILASMLKKNQHKNVQTNNNKVNSTTNRSQK